AEPTKLLPERSTVNSKLPLQAMAILPSILMTSFSNSISINSSFGHGDSKHKTPFPCTPRLNSPSFPATAEEKLLRITAFCFKDDSQAKNKPSSNTTEPFHSSKFNNKICL